MRIHKTNDPKSEFTVMNYAEILSVNCEQIKDKTKVLERWTFEFTLETKFRTYILYAPSGDEKQLWFHSFKWICECNIL